MWENLSNAQKSEYKKMILAFASLTEMFAQKEDSSEDGNNISPIINSKYQETVFQRVFNASAEDIGNTSYDVALEAEAEDGSTIKYLIGIKTFGIASGDQKVAQFKGNQNDWIGLIDQIRRNYTELTQQGRSKWEIDEINAPLYLQIAQIIANLRNLRIDSSESNITGFSILEGHDTVVPVYHVLMPSAKGSSPSISVGETSYDKIDTENITILGSTTIKNPTNFTFTDGHHRYKFTSADSQLLMDFRNSEIVRETWPVAYAEDAYAIFADIAEKVFHRNTSRIVESYSWKIEVHPYSGFNSFNGVGSKLGSGERTKRIEAISRKYNGIIKRKKLDQVIEGLKKFLLTEKDNSKKEQIRTEVMTIVKQTNNPDFKSEITKVVYRPKEEIYIPIRNSRTFHNEHPNFFGPGYGDIVSGKGARERTTFMLTLEPSGEQIECFIAQDSGKAIESTGKQSIMGEWLLRKVFQLKEYEPLTEKRLNEVGINGIRLYKTKDKKIHLEFIWIEDNKMPEDYWG